MIEMNVRTIEINGKITFSSVQSNNISEMSKFSIGKYFIKV